MTRVAYTADGWGEGEVWFERTRLVWHELPRPRPEPTGARRRRPVPTRSSLHPHPGGAEPSRLPLGATIPTFESHVSSGTAPDARRLVDRLTAYFAGERTEFDDVELDLDDLTDFQRAVADTLRGVPYGEIVSYGELARAAGHPNAQRAAGTFCAHNRYPLVLPCHRVVAAGGPGSYGSLGIDYKRRLLELEGVAV